MKWYPCMGPSFQSASYETRCTLQCSFTVFHFISCPKFRGNTAQQSLKHMNGTFFQLKRGVQVCYQGFEGVLTALTSSILYKWSAVLLVHATCNHMRRRCRPVSCCQSTYIDETDILQAEMLLGSC